MVNQLTQSEQIGCSSLFSPMPVGLLQCLSVSSPVWLVGELKRVSLHEPTGFLL